ncbi:S9 family peptidase [Mongoliitalea daihaiensis]|uniref:S9 family peptidase n=1 Tax=Mongoliitalea daihaiensis TaxID=2782006 RepID=UPI001F32503C|nr:prolyl oligopeptidase family serine peptidase [Mongoliitalea daihaiensis]UJP64430.1 S9 family peptidase [Mongoliitalea daihaiensis]
MKQFFFLILFCWSLASVQAQRFSVQDISSFPFPSELTASPVDEQLAWTMNEQGKRNVFIAKAPTFEALQITDFLQDDGQEITSLQFSPDGKELLFVRGGEHGSNWDPGLGINPSQMPFTPKVEIWKVAIADRKAEKLTEGDDPMFSPDGTRIVFIKNRQLWMMESTGKNLAPLLETTGTVSQVSWSPDGKSLLFSVNRGTHSMIATVDMFSKQVSWIAPSFYKDAQPTWSQDGQYIAFIRLPGGRPEPFPILEQRHSPWEIWVYDRTSGQAKFLWKAPETLRGSVPTTHGSFNLRWVANNTLTFLSYEDGWPHLYAMDLQGNRRQLTQGDFMVEHVSLSHDGQYLYFSANTGPAKEDIDRRHVTRVHVASGDFEVLTPGEGIEAIPVPLAGGNFVGLVSSTVHRPLIPAVFSHETQSMTLIAEDRIPSVMPRELVVPKQVVFESPDGLKVHGQLFVKEGGAPQKPGIVFVHGGPQRQMLLGWHYGDYYSNTYAVNQYLAELGFAVLSVNFRLGIGYGFEFHRPARTYWQGAEEYLDVKAAGEYLASLDVVDGERIGIYGGSYGGYLTALALGRDSDLFKVGVDIHGVHELSSRLVPPAGFEKAPDFDRALRTAWLSSPLAYLDTWTSPVLFIHGDDDRNVNVSHTADIIRRFDERNMPYEYLMIPDDSHHWMKFENLVKVNAATVAFLRKHLNP